MENIKQTKALADRIKKLRKEKTSFSQEAFALYIGMDRAQYSRVENGKMDIRFSTLARVCKGFGIELSELVEGISVDDIPLYEKVEIKKEN